MLSLRLAIFAALFGIALWGLFSLLGNLREPELLRSDKAILVKGCEKMEAEPARSVCPQLFCQKFLLDGSSVPRRSQFKVTVDARAGSEHLIGGVVQSGAAGSEQRFACVLSGHKVTAGQLVDAAHLEALAAEPASWSLEP
ncbi:MAG TPA: hypothetical protein VJS12_16870 [Steroidobacteraceae bacterium]|nr:hypothetical protein [Steroidobacteraceae bacterium]